MSDRVEGYLTAAIVGGIAYCAWLILSRMQQAWEENRHDAIALRAHLYATEETCSRILRILRPEPETAA